MMQEIEFTKHFQRINESNDLSSDRLSGGSDETVKITNKKYLCRVISYEKLTSYLTEDFS